MKGGKLTLGGGNRTPRQSVENGILGRVGEKKKKGWQNKRGRFKKTRRRVEFEKLKVSRDGGSAGKKKD